MMHDDSHRDAGKQRIDTALWRELWSYTRPHRTHVRRVAVLGIITAITDIAFTVVTKHVIDDIDLRGMETPFLGWGAVYFGLAVLLASCVRLFIRETAIVRTSLGHDIRTAGFAKLQRLSFAFYDQHATGWLMSRMTSDIERLSNILAWGTLDLCWGLTLMTGIAGVMLFYHPLLALAVLAVVPLLLLATMSFKRRLLATARDVRRTNSRLTAGFSEALQGVRTSKIFVREQADLRAFSSLTGEMYDASTRNQLLSAAFLPVALTLGSLGMGVALALGGVEVLGGAISLGTLIAFVSFTRHFFDPVNELSHWLAEMQTAQASAERILGLIAEVPSIRDSHAVEAAIAARRGDVVAAGVAHDGLPDRAETIEFRKVDFSYGDGTPALTGLDLVVRPGQRIALVGPTGGGKTTLVSLLARFYEPTAGEILVDGVEYRQRSLAWWQAGLGIVLQTPHLFDDTVANNIRYGDPRAGDAEIEEAARAVGADDLFRALPHGYSTRVGEGGGKLSMGERQLVSFARAVLANPRVLILDEATSSIDVLSEQRVQRGLRRVLAGRTSFVIAHRLSTIRHADLILVVEGGRVVERGTHDELLARNGRYANLAQRQLLGVARDPRAGTDARANAR